MPSFAVVELANRDPGRAGLVTATDRDIVNYGEQRIRAGEQAAFSLRSSDLRQPLRLPDGSQVLPQPGLSEDQVVAEPTAEPTNVPTREPVRVRKWLGMDWEDFLGMLWLGAIALLALGLLLWVVRWLSRRKPKKQAAKASKRAKAAQTKRAPAAAAKVPTPAPVPQAEAPLYCAQCGALNEPQDRFCTQCGQPLPRG